MKWNICIHPTTSLGSELLVDYYFALKPYQDGELQSS